MEPQHLKQNGVAQWNGSSSRMVRESLEIGHIAKKVTTLEPLGISITIYLDYCVAHERLVDGRREKGGFPIGSHLDGSAGSG